MKRHLIALFILNSGYFVFGQRNRNEVIDTSASCDQKYIYFRLNFQRPFQGVIYSENAYSSCLYVNGSLNPRVIYDIRVPLNKCQTRYLPTGLYENSVIVQQDPRLLESTDQKFLLTCGPGDSGNQDNKFTVSFGGLTVQGTLGSTQLVTGRGGSGPGSINYKVEVQSGFGPDSPAVRSAVAVGESISYVIRIPNLTNSDARVGYCWANDGVSEIQLSDKRGCTLQPTGDVWGTFESRRSGDNKVLWNDIRAWAFPTSNRVNIFCNLHLCSGICSQDETCTTRRSLRQTQILRPSHILTFADVDRISRPNNGAAEKGSDVIEVEGSFEVIPSLRRTNTLEAFHERQRDVRVVTGATPFYSEIQSREKICIDQLHFGIGVALLLVVILVSFFFILAIGCRNFHKSRNAKSTPMGFERDSQFEWNRSNLNVSTLSSSVDTSH